MKTLAVVRGKYGLLWREIPNSAQLDTTISSQVGKQVFHFLIEHIHTDLDHDLRVLCFKVTLPQEGQPLIEDCDIHEKWLARVKATQSQNAAIGQAVRAWDCK